MATFINGKVKRKNNIFRVIETEEDVYNTSQLNLTGVEYNPATIIEDEELYKVSQFSQSGYSFEFLENDLNSVNHDQITRTDLTKLSFICTVQNNLYFFQIINSSIFISKKWFSIDELTLETEKPIITVNPFADAIYDKHSNTLYFKRLTAAQKIFKWMDQLYKEATATETDSFLQKDFPEVDSDFDHRNVSVLNRKRIALVMETLNNLSDSEKQAVYSYTSEYSQVVFEDEKFKIETDDDLKFVLWGIQQRFYTTPIGGEKRIANSIISI
ncbi:hypothetical protein [Epilithonimonas vandammei]|uniref:hypothetical protein n=1 Tax=Epilithonimonas vandammei TaxID=2487072 RepID=UPI0028A5DE11|nr:hypothetical protein [Epilithonimonas vandammei]